MLPGHWWQFVNECHQFKECLKLVIADKKREGAKKVASSHMKAWLKSYQIWCNNLKNWHDVIDNDLPGRIKLFLNSE